MQPPLDLPGPFAAPRLRPGPPRAAVPNFLIIGAAKAATTSLSSLLEQHPEAAIVQWKEPHFFSFDKHYRLGWEAYLRLYGHCRGEKAIGDASTSYSRIRHHPETLARIQRHLADPKIVYMVRHPLERMESAYVEHLRSPGLSYASLSEAVLRQPMIVDSSRYWEVFDAYRTRFGESRIKIVWFEEYTAHPVPVFQEVCRFLGIDDRFVPDLSAQERNGRSEVLAQVLGVQRKVTAIDATWRPDLRRAVIETLREDNERFLAHFGRPRDHWDGLFTA